MIPYDVQLLGAITLHNGKVSEMKKKVIIEM
jgi:preprotein translocase subunit SecA